MLASGVATKASRYPVASTPIHEHSLPHKPSYCRAPPRGPQAVPQACWHPEEYGPPATEGPTMTSRGRSIRRTMALAAGLLQIYKLILPISRVTHAAIESSWIGVVLVDLRLQGSSVLPVPSSCLSLHTKALNKFRLQSPARLTYETSKP